MNSVPRARRFLAAPIGRALGCAALLGAVVPAQGSFANYGQGCVGSNGRVPKLLAFEFPTIGASMSRRMHDGPPNALAFQLLGFGALDIPLAIIGAGSCSLLVDNVLSRAAMTDANGDAELSLQLPNDPMFVGAQLRTQFAAIDFGANPFGLVFTAGGLDTLGAQSPMPVASSAQMQRGPTPGESVIEVRFAEQVGVAAMTISPEGNPSLLRDDGRDVDPVACDGVYHARVRANFDAELTAFQARAPRLRQRSPIPQFDGRQLTRIVDASSLPLQAGPDRFPLLAVGNGASATSAALDPKKTLMITFPPVINDPTRTWNPCSGIGNPNGVWTFKHLMTEICNQPHTGMDPRDFVFNWMQSFTTPQTANGFTVAPRPGAAAFLASWPLDGMGKLNLDLAPFRLLAIVNRVDLRSGSFYGGGDAGEGRFVFCSVNCTGSFAEQFLVIFEYKIPISGCVAVRAWGQQWANLDTMVLGSPAYNAALEAITLQFTERNLAPSAPNRSALGQLRTNEIAFGPIWELREYRVFSPTLNMTTVAQTPDLSFQDTSFLRNFLITKPASPPIPLLDGITPLRGASSITPIGFFWDFPSFPGLPSAKRHAFSVNTCNGCHAGETETAFTHVKPAFFPFEPLLSQFLIGDTGNPTDAFYHDVFDPAGSGDERLFFDLDRRAEDLDTLISSSCFSTVLSVSLSSHLHFAH